MNDWICNKKQAAQFFKVSVQALDGWFLRGCPVFSKHESGSIESLNLSDMAAWRVKQTNESDELNIEKTRLTKAQADKTELEVEVLRGSLVPVDKVEMIWANLCAGARNRLLSIPYKTAIIVQGVTEFQAIETAVRSLIYEALHAIDGFDPAQYASSPADFADTDSKEKPKKSPVANPARKKNKSG